MRALTIRDPSTLVVVDADPRNAAIAGLSNVIAWYSPDIADQRSLSGSNFTSLHDRIGSRDLTKAGTENITVGSMGGRECMTVVAPNGSARMAATSAVFGTYPQPTTICIVARHEPTGAGTVPVLIDSDSSTQSSLLTFGGTWRGDANSSWNSAYTSETDIPVFLWLEYNGASSAFYVNNVQRWTGNPGNAGFTGLRIFNSRTPSNGWRGDAGDIVFMTSIQSSGQRTAVWEAFQEWWSI